MTKTDLKILYHQETGHEVKEIDKDTIDETLEYIEWLENKLLTLYNMP